MSPTQRSKALLQKQGWFVAITERWNPYAKIRQDLFGFIDLLAIRGDIILAVQTTSGSNVSARVNKILALESAKKWIAPSRRIVVHGWRKCGPRGSVKRWQCREVEIVPEDFSTGQWRSLASEPLADSPSVTCGGLPRGDL